LGIYSYLNKFFGLSNTNPTFPSWPRPLPTHLIGSSKIMRLPHFKLAIPYT
jgi:hypothetical protein